MLNFFTIAMVVWLARHGLYNMAERLANFLIYGHF